MKRIYVAGAISNPILEKGLTNIRKGIIKGVELLKLGYAPYIPHLDYQFNLMQDDHIDVELYYRYDLEWLSVCEAVLVVEGWEESKGVKAELEFAKKHNIPIYYNVKDLLDNE